MQETSHWVADFVYQNTAPTSNVLADIIRQAGYDKYAEQQLLTWTIYTADSGPQVAKRLSAVIGRGYPYSNAMGSGTIVGVDIP